MANKEYRLPPAEKTKLDIGYLRLTDSAPIIMAMELGLYEKYGLDVTLHREVSWANLRDKVATGLLDGGQMLAPLPMATTLGGGGIRADMVTGLALSLNGNAITLAAGLASELKTHGATDAESPKTTALGLANWIKESGKSLTLASAHSFSWHTFLLHDWLSLGGLAPDKDVKIIVLPPEQMVDSLSRGIIDGYCVGEPWNSIAVQQGIGAIQATGYHLARNCIEKVLGVTADWHQKNPATHLRLRLALLEAGQWFIDRSNREVSAEVLSRSNYLDLPLRQLMPSLSGQMQFEKEGEILEMPHFHVFGKFNAGFPWRSDAEDLSQRCLELLRRDPGNDEVMALAQKVYRPDLYREAARILGISMPDSDYRDPA